MPRSGLSQATAEGVSAGSSKRTRNEWESWSISDGTRSRSFGTSILSCGATLMRAASKAIRTRGLRENSCCGTGVIQTFWYLSSLCHPGPMASLQYGLRRSRWSDLRKMKRYGDITEADARSSDHQNCERNTGKFKTQSSQRQLPSLI